MRIKLLISRATTKGVQEIGDIIDVPDYEAFELIQKDLAVRVVEETIEIETAISEPKRETAVKKYRRKRRAK